MKFFIRSICAFLLTYTLAATVFAAGWTSQVSPTTVEVARGQGFFVFGAFGNPSSCTATGAFWVSINHPQYEMLFSLVTTAIVSGKTIKAYSHQCATPGWHGGTYNEVTGNGAIYLYQSP